MRSSKIARRYARALLGLATDTTQSETWGAELERLGRMVDAPEIATVFASPEVTLAVKIEALAKIGEKLELSYPVRSCATVVARHGRIDSLSAIAEAYQRMLDDQMGRARASLIFAATPGDDELTRVVSGLEAIAHKQIIPTVTVDAALIGGVVVELEGKTYDGSLASQLAEATRRLASQAQ